MLDRLIEKRAHDLLREHEGVYGKIHAAVPVSGIAEDTLDHLVGETPDPRTKLAPENRPNYGAAAVLIYPEREIWLRSSDHHHRKRFSLAHEIGHSVLHNDIREEARSGQRLFACGDEDVSETTYATTRLELQANAFASELLLPALLLEPRVRGEDAQLSMIMDLATLFDVSPECMAIRVARAAWQPYAMIVSLAGHVNFSFCSTAMKEFASYDFIHKGTPVDRGTITAEYFKRPELISTKATNSHVVAPDRWFLGYDGEAVLIEETIGLGFGKVLTILTTDYEDANAAEDEGDDEGSEDDLKWS